jgi:hypothetical protein
MFGYVDRDGDGYREMPDGSPLTLHRYSAPSSRDQQFDELWKRGLDDIGIRVEMVKEKWPDTLKKAREGKVQFWTLATRPRNPTRTPGSPALRPEHRAEPGALQAQALRRALRAGAGHARHAGAHEALPGDDQAHRRVRPWRINSNRIRTDMWYPQLIGYRRHPC